MGVPCIVPKITTYQPGWNWRLICSHRIVCLSLYEGGKLRQGMWRPVPDDITHTQSPFCPCQQATAPGGHRHGAWNRQAPLRTLVDALSAARRQPFWAVGNHGGFRVSLKHSILQRQPVGCSLQVKTPVCLPLRQDRSKGNTIIQRKFVTGLVYFSYFKIQANLSFDPFFMHHLPKF